MYLKGYHENRGGSLRVPERIIYGWYRVNAFPEVYYWSSQKITQKYLLFIYRPFTYFSCRKLLGWVVVFFFKCIDCSRDDTLSGLSQSILAFLPVSEIKLSCIFSIWYRWSRGFERSLEFVNRQFELSICNIQILTEKMKIA